MAIGVKNTAITFPVYLASYADPRLIKTTPTLAAGDVTVSKDGGNANNIGTLPSESPAGSGRLTVTLTADENNADNVAVKFHDQTATPEWCDMAAVFLNNIRGVDDLSHHSAADVWAVATRTLTSFGTLVDDIHDEVVEGAHTFRQMIRLIAANLFGETTGGGTTTPEFLSLDGTKTRITGTVDESGNRSDVTLDGS